MSGLDAIVGVIMAEFPDCWWEANSQGYVKLSIDFEYWSEDHGELWSDASVFEEHFPGDPRAALCAVLEQARDARTGSMASLAKRPSTTQGD